MTNEPHEADRLREVVILGTGGFALELAGMLPETGYHLLGFIGPESGHRLPGDRLGGDEVLATTPEDSLVLVAVGDPRLRRRLFSIVEQARRVPAGFRHDRAWVSPEATIHPSVIIYPHATVHAGVTLGRGSVVNSNATIGHETSVGDFCTIGPAVALGGHMSIGEGSYLGIGACAIENLTIAAHSVVGGGAAVVSNLTEAATYVGVPARPRGS